MAIGKLVAPLLRVPLFAGLKPLQITEIARLAERCRFEQGDVITRAGDEADGAYLIASGLADRVAGEGGAAASEPIEPGSLVGEMAMLVEHRYGATVVARDRVLCLKITRAALRAQLEEDPALALHLQRRITDRLARVADDLRRIDETLAACGSRATSAAMVSPPAATAGSL
jgi:CRP-like cAMP-binding protein